MKRSCCLFLAVGALSMGLNAANTAAGTATFSGRGQEARPPEFVEITYTVSSECYRTASEAKTANDAMVAAMIDILDANKTTGRDAYALSAPSASKFSRMIHTDDGPREVCSNTYRRSTKITYTLNDLSKVSDIYWQIDEGVSALSTASSTEDAMSYVSVGGPSPDVCKETRVDMKKAARKLARDDAYLKFNEAADEYGLTNCYIIDFSENALSPKSYHEFASYAEFGDSAPSVQFDFGNVKEDAYYEFKYAFDCPMTRCTAPSSFDFEAPFNLD